MDVPIRDAAGREVDPVTADDPGRQARDRRAPRRARACRPGRPEPCLVPVEVVDDADVRPRCSTPSGVLLERADQWKYWPPSMTIVWPVMKSAAGVQRKTAAPTTSSGTWSRWIVRAATDTSRSASTTFGLRLHALRHREPGRDAVDVDRVLPELLRERARQRDDRALGRDVVEEERNAAERRARGDVHDLAPPCSRIAGTTARQVRNIEATLTSMTRFHSSSGISVNTRISSEA